MDNGGKWKGSRAITDTGHSLTDLHRLVILEVVFPDFVMQRRLLVNARIEMLAKSDAGRLEAALSEMVAAGLLLRFDCEVESSALIAGAASESDILTAIEQLRRQFAYSIRVGPMQASYRETMTAEAVSDFSHKRVFFGKGQFARVKVKLTPVDMSMDCVVKINSPELAAETAYARGAEKGLRSVLASGPFAGFPLTGVEVTVEDAAWHDEDSSELAFEIAARAAVREGMARSNVELVEPIMELELQSEEGIPATLRYELNLRGAWMVGHREDASGPQSLFMIPLANSFGLADVLKDRFEGKIAATLEFSHYAVVSPEGGSPLAAALR